MGLFTKDDFGTLTGKEFKILKEVEEEISKTEEEEKRKLMLGQRDIENLEALKENISEIQNFILNSKAKGAYVNPDYAKQFEKKLNNIRKVIDSLRKQEANEEKKAQSFLIKLESLLKDAEKYLAKGLEAAEKSPF